MKPSYEISGSSSAGPLEIGRIELRFENGFGSTTAGKSEQLAAEAILRFTGSGPFRGEWQVDGRPVEQFNLVAAGGSTLRLRTLYPSSLPTFEPGPHEVTLNVLEPPLTFPVPTIRYMVTMGNQN